MATPGTICVSWRIALVTAMQKRKPGQPHKGWKDAARESRKAPAMSDLYNSDLHEPTAEADADGLLVYCVMCIDDDDGGCCVHIFSTQEKAQAFAATAARLLRLHDRPSRADGAGSASTIAIISD